MISVGVDVVEIERVERALRYYGESFMKRIFTPGEIAYCQMQARGLAVRFAAKEAVSKAIGTGLTYASGGGVTPSDIEVVNDNQGRPCIRLHGQARVHASRLGLRHWSVSLSHARRLAVAFVTAASDLPLVTGVSNSALDYFQEQMVHRDDRCHTLLDIPK